MSIFALLTRCYREKATKAFLVTQVLNDGELANEGLVYFQNGLPKSSIYNELIGEESLLAIYKCEREGKCLLYKELDYLDIYTENIVSEKFDEIILSLLENYRRGKICNWHIDKNIHNRQNEFISFLQ